MKVADFFCGAGGFSEGFRQAGFDIVFALDKWQPAVTTHHANHPNAKTILADIIKVSLLPDNEFDELIPDTEVIIGSPPCVAFSNSNKSGKGDKTLGLKLLNSYLRIIARKKFKKNSILKYWVLENVPNIQEYIKPIYTSKELGLEGDFELKVINESAGVYNAKNFGVASNRNRFLCGDFPKPKFLINDEKNVKTLREILNNLGEPCENVKNVVKDPNYDFYMKSFDISDHHYINEIAEFEWRKAKRLKEDRGYMGKMSFPENLDKPARTVMATMSCSSRESMIFPYKNDRFRLPTVREAASIMSFPIDYKFYSTSISIKYKLVGNAVPPKLSNAIAKSIARKENTSLFENYIPIKQEEKCTFYNLNFHHIPLNIEKPKRDVARFKYHIPYTILNAYRVELTNYHSDFQNKEFKWSVEIHKSQGKNAKIFVPNIDAICLPENVRSKVLKFIKEIHSSISSHNDFQKIFCLTDINRKALVGPYELLDKIKLFLDDNLILEQKNLKLKFDEPPYELPLEIITGYIILKKIIEFMGGK